MKKQIHKNAGRNAGKVASSLNFFVRFCRLDPTSIGGVFCAKFSSPAEMTGDENLATSKEMFEKVIEPPKTAGVYDRLMAEFAKSGVIEPLETTGVYDRHALNLLRPAV